MCDSPGNTAASTYKSIGTLIYDCNSVYLSNVKL